MGGAADRDDEQKARDLALTDRLLDLVLFRLHGVDPADVEGFRDKCTETGLKDIILYIGGMLTSTDESWEWTERQFKAVGFDRVYPPEVNLDDVMEDLRTDLRAKGKL